MILSMSGQAWLFLHTVGLGVAIGVFYDLFRIFRRTMPHFSLIVQLEDLFFWVAVTGVMFYFMLSRNFGEIRPFSILGAGCGIAIYFATVSKYVVGASVAVINYLKRVFAAAFRILTLPVRYIWLWVSPFIKKFLGNRRKDLRNTARYGKMKIKKTTREWLILRKKV